MTEELLNPMVGAEPEVINEDDEAAALYLWGIVPEDEDDEIEDEEIEDEDDEIEKALGKPRNVRQAQLVRRLKTARGYPKPVRGGTGKQRRTRRRKFGG